MTAICIPFYRYQPQVGDWYKIYFESLLYGLKIWGNEFDHLYLIDQEWGFTEEDYERIVAIKGHGKVTIIKSTVTGHHWNQFKMAIPQIKEDTILFMDNDVFIWKKGIVAGWFKEAETADIVTAFDGSGGLRDIIWNRWPIMKLLNATRMGSYYFILHKTILDRIPDFDFAPINYPVGTCIKELKNYITKEGDWSDSFGLFTIKLLALKPKISIIKDDRSSISFPDIKTSEPLKLGYYHIRNGNLPIYTLASKLSHPEDYERVKRDTPRSELTRLFGWFHMLVLMMPQLVEKYERADIFPFINDIGIHLKEWGQYLKKMEEFHGL